MGRAGPVEDAAGIMFMWGTMALMGVRGGLSIRFLMDGISTGRKAERLTPSMRPVPKLYTVIGIGFQTDK